METKNSENIFSRLWQAIVNFFKQSPPPESPVSEAPSSDNKSKEDAPMEELSRLYQFHQNIFPEMSEELRQSITGIMDGSWKLGFADGALGQRQMPRSFFRTHAEQVRNQYLFFLEGKRIPWKTALDEREAKAEKAKEVLGQAEQYRNDVITRRQLYPRNFSKVLAIIYIGIAILLLIADIPLALMVTQFIINIESADSNHEINQLFFLSGSCKESFPSHVWLVFCSNWQVFLMTIGIALSAIYFKIFYDDFMGYPVDKSVRQFKLLSSNKIRDDQEDPIFTDKEEKEIRSKYKIRLIAKSLILLFTIGTIWYLGLIRAESQKYLHQLDASAGSTPITTSLNNTAKTLDISPPSSNTGFTEADAERLNEMEKIMYILLTILLPLMAGICFSLGMGNYHNRRESTFAEKIYIKKREDHTGALKEHTEAQMYFSTYDSFIKKCDESFTGNYEECFYNCYLHGYQRGVVSPDKNLDMYERALKFRDRLLATKSTEAIQRANENVNPVNPFTQN